MKLLHLFIEIILIKLLSPFWWGCCGGCSSCGGMAYQPTISYLNFPIYQRIPNQEIPDEPQNPLVILHRKTIIKEVPYDDESEEERPRYIYRARKIRPQYESEYEPERYIPEKPVEKIVYVQQPPPNYNIYTTPQPPMYIPQGGNINMGQSEIPYNSQQYQQNVPQTSYQQPQLQQSYQNSPQPIMQTGNQQQYRKKYSS
ncbi:Hypothetical protein SRAE_2000041600 [Strongyloides ratti]|uniref:Uncharacterized protein n=1 Tax=Strongyloides ratti TaxID=34506 RepID=A0A090LE37_STRRB|nr:Hypothetical protein SRAE_2000041600 [Strongyloides ratti]CEF65740.1 Hypothetical protein SRAE_2000041600 [Strongyloides ratti]